MAAKKYPEIRIQAHELALSVANEIDASLRQGIADHPGVTITYIELISDSLESQNCRQLERLLPGFANEVTTIKASELMRRYNILLVESYGFYTGKVELSPR